MSEAAFVIICNRFMVQDLFMSIVTDLIVL